VSDDGVGLDAQGSPERGEGDHDGEERGLHDVDALERERALFAREEVEEGPIDVRRQGARAGFELGLEDG
jgi:hypothetical protein